MTRKRYIKLMRAVNTFPTREKYIQMCIRFIQQLNRPYSELLVSDILREQYIRRGVPLPRELRRE